MRWLEIDALFEEALALGEDEREAFVAQSCGDDAALRRKLDRLLAASESEPPALATLANGPVWRDLLRSLSNDGSEDEPDAVSVATRVHLSIGTMVGPFRVLGSIGAGGMGQVFRARDTRLKRLVALKVLRSDSEESTDLVRRFEREARAASALNHPNIVTIYDIGYEEEFAYLAMEHIEGQTLEAILADGRLPVAQALELAGQVARGLAAAHAEGIVHRDLKPGNIMVSADGAVKIVDFGLAKPMKASVLPVSKDRTLLLRRELTMTGVILGTVGYMSPEQAAGKEADYRADQFSYGAVLYEMLTGRKPFGRDTLVEALAATLKEVPEPVVNLNPETPLPLQWIVERCLAKEPAERYDSTTELLGDIESVGSQLGRTPVLQVSPNRGLPADRTSFVGREREIRAVTELLTDGDVRLLTLTGVGGTGKTRVALQVAAGLQEHFAGEVYFIPLASLSDPALVPATIVSQLGLRLNAEGSAETSLLSHLSRPSCPATLLVLDNLEHLLGAARSIASLLDVAPKVKVLVTSREVLRIYGEREFALAPLELPPATTLVAPDKLARYSAVTLFLERAASVRSDFEFTAENASAVVEICRRLDGLPLVIELAAARLKMLEPSQILDRLETRLEFLIGGTRDLPERHQTLRATIDWSYALLADDEKRLFRRMAVFVGGCTLEAIEAVCDAVEDLGIDVATGVESLLDKSLLSRSDGAGEPRFEMLATLREYGLEQFRESGDEAITRKAHAAYFMILAEEGHAALQQPGSTAWLQRFDQEHDNLRAALGWLIEENATDWAFRLSSAMWQFWAVREHLAEGRAYLTRVLELPGAGRPSSRRVEALVGIQSLVQEQGDFEAALTLHREHVEITRVLGDRLAEGLALYGLATHLVKQGANDEARRHCKRALELAEEVGDAQTTAGVLSTLARVLAADGQPQRALEMLGRAVEVLRDLGDPLALAWMTNLEGDFARRAGDLARARTCLEGALEQFYELEDPRGIADCLQELGTVARLEGANGESVERYTQSLELFRTLGHRRGLSRVLEGFACLAASRGEAARTLRLAGAAAGLQQALSASVRSTDKETLDSELVECRRLLGTAAQDEWMAGWSMPLEEVLAEALGE